MSDTGPNPRFERLLEHMAWLRRLAQSLLSDPGEVDDIVQETWVAALEHTGGKVPVRDERAWLGGVFRNVMRQSRRSRSRALHREGQVARPESLPATGDLVEQADMQIRMLQAVVALHEPYRSTLLMRYFEELSAEEIGQRLGEPASTVRNRHKRALELLRERLDRTHGGDRKAWCLLMIPIAVPKGAGAASVAVAATATHGAWTMSLQILAATVSIALVGWGTSVSYRSLGGDAEASAPVEHRVALVGEAEAEAEAETRLVGMEENEASIAAPATVSATREQEGQEREPVAAGQSPKHVLRGRVVDGESQPVAGARVFVGGRPNPWDGPVEAGMVLAVDLERREMELQERKRRVMEIEAQRREMDREQSDGQGGRSKRRLPETHEKEAEEEHVARLAEKERVRLQEERELQEQARRLEQAEVELVQQQLGFDHLARIERPMEGLEEWRGAGANELERSGVVLGKYLVTDGEGRFELKLDQAAELFVTVLGRPGLRKTHPGAWHGTSAEDVTLTVECVPTATVGLRLVDSATGAPVPRWIGVIERNGLGLTDWEAEGPVEQVVEVPEGQPGSFRVTVRQPTWAQQSVEFELAGGDEREVEITVDSGLGLRGSVVDTLGRPVEGAFVYWGQTLDMRGNTIFGRHDPQRVFDGVETGADGSFHLPGEADWVTVWHSEHTPTTLKPVEAVRVRLVGRGDITGMLPAKVFQELVYLSKQENEHGKKSMPAVLLDREIRAEIDAQGGFSFPSVEAGVHGLSIGERMFTGVHVRPGETAHVTWDVPLTGARVQMRSSGRPIEGVGHVYFAGLDSTFTLGETMVRHRGDEGLVFGLEGQRFGRYVVYSDKQHIGFFELDGRERVTVDLGHADLAIHGAPGRSLYLVPADLTENPIVRRLASLFPQRIPEAGVLTLEPLAVGRYAIYGPKEGQVAEIDVRGPGASVTLP